MVENLGAKIRVANDKKLAFKNLGCRGDLKLRFGGSRLGIGDKGKKRRRH